MEADAMKTNAQLLAAVAVMLAAAAPALAEPVSMPAQLTREIRSQGAAALKEMTVDAVRLDARERAMANLGAALERSAPVMAGRDTAAVVPCAAPVFDGRVGAAALVLPTISLPQLPQLR